MIQVLKYQNSHVSISSRYIQCWDLNHQPSGHKKCYLAFRLSLSCFYPVFPLLSRYECAAGPFTSHSIFA